ncbi:MAG: MmcQ/YjbR family DNA-binding protein [Clostridiales bacterium]|jgi:predicted DNA-binding protein (MmcQ/YjbR family)|nr:MmcQ/YjbR family DNA-binding protein [Clostridiales bacterium]
MEKHVKIDDLTRYILSKRAVTVKARPQWEWVKFLFCDRMFALLHKYKDGRDVLSARLPDGELYAMREEFPDVVVPAYGLEPLRWNTLFLDAPNAEIAMFRAVDAAYNLAFKSVSPIAQKLYLSTQTPPKYSKVPKNSNFYNVEFDPEGSEEDGIVDLSDLMDLKPPKDT